jgi:hypothetical protein
MKGMGDMTQNRQRRIRRCFIVTGGLGLFLVLFGIFVMPTIPYFQLDAVLTPDQLRDEKLMDETLMMLQKVLGNQPQFCMLFGLAIVAASAVGFSQARESHIP